jgi:hypothetical protein
MKINHLTIDISSVQRALKQQRDRDGKETNPCHYMNEVGLIRFALAGDFTKPFDLKILTGEQLLMARRVICLNRRLIRLHVRYEDRKQACREFVLKHQAQT